MADHPALAHEGEPALEDADGAAQGWVIGEEEDVRRLFRPPSVFERVSSRAGLQTRNTDGNVSRVVNRALYCDHDAA